MCENDILLKLNSSVFKKLKDGADDPRKVSYDLLKRAIDSLNLILERKSTIKCEAALEEYIVLVKLMTYIFLYHSEKSENSSFAKTFFADNIRIVQHLLESIEDDTEAIKALISLYKMEQKHSHHTDMSRTSHHSHKSRTSHSHKSRTSHSHKSRTSHHSHKSLISKTDEEMTLNMFTSGLEMSKTVMDDKTCGKSEMQCFICKGNSKTQSSHINTIPTHVDYFGLFFHKKCVLNLKKTMSDKLISLGCFKNNILINNSPNLQLQERYKFELLAYEYVSRGKKSFYEHTLLKNVNPLDLARGIKKTDFERCFVCNMGLIDREEKRISPKSKTWTQPKSANLAWRRNNMMAWHTKCIKEVPTCIINIIKTKYGELETYTRPVKRRASTSA
jgi:hypothetical protein